MSSPLTFTAACNQFKGAACGLVYAAWRAPFSGGKVRMVAIGLPVLFITTGTGAIIYGVMKTVLKAAGRTFAEGVGAIYQSCTKNHQPPLSEEERRRQFFQRGNISIPMPQAANQNQSSQRIVITERRPLPKDSAKERNEAFEKLINLLNEYFIEPWIINNEKLLKQVQPIDPLFKSIIEDSEEFRSFLRAVALWQFGIRWDQGEANYLKFKTPPIPTLKSIRDEIDALNIGSNLKENLLNLVVETDGESIEENVNTFQKIATNHEGLNGNKKKLLLLSLRLDGVLRNKPKSEEELELDENKNRHDFSVGMNEIVANSLVHLVGIVEGVMKGIEKTSSTKTEIPLDLLQDNEEDQPQSSMLTEQQQTLTHEVEEIITVISDQLRKRYSKPLYYKHKEKWEGVAEKTIDSENIMTQFLEGEITDLEFLQSEEATLMPTEQISAIFFLKTLQTMENRADFKGFIHRIPLNLLTQMKPALIGVLDKTVEMISGINLERTTLKVVDIIEELLTCCDAMKLINQNQEPLSEGFFNLTSRPTDLFEALKAGEIDEDCSEEISKLHTNISFRDTQGGAIIDRLNGSAHKNVLTDQNNPAQTELDWIQDTTVKIKRLLRATTSKANGLWLATLLDSKGIKTNGWIGLILSLKDKIKTYSPAIANILEGLLGGVQALIENEGAVAIQKAIDKISSAGSLSTNIALSMMKSFLDLSTKDKDWKEKLPLLQEAYRYLSPDEKMLILDRLNYLYKGDQLNQRTEELTETSSTPPNDKTKDLLDREEAHSLALKGIEKAHAELKKDPENNKDAIETLKTAYGELETQKGLIQFERVKELVLYVANDELNKVMSFYGGDSIRQLIMAVIEEAFDLLRYQKVVKHWIFTIVDLLIYELQLASGIKFPEKETEFISKINLEKEPSIFEIIEAHNRNTNLMNKVATTASNCNRDWGIAGNFASANYYFSNWTGGKIWSALKTPLNDKLRVTSKELANKAVKTITDFGTNTNSLSTVLVEALTEHVADPRPEPAPGMVEEVEDSETYYDAQQDFDNT